MRAPARLGAAATLAVVLSSCSLLGGAATEPPVAEAISCPNEGQWTVASQPGMTSTTAVLDHFAAARVVLLGESHDRLEDHRWQLQVLAALQGRTAEMVIALEMLPRSSQPALEQWGEGRIDVEEFLSESRWLDVWGYSPDLYLPILHFGRMNGIPMRAINVDSDLVMRTSAEGWSSVGVDERGGLSDPAEAPKPYRELLTSVYSEHLPEGAEVEPVAVERFVEAQLLWDRAFAEGIWEARAEYPDAIVVALIGRGHLEHGYGVAHQLNDLGLVDHVTLLTWDVDLECDEHATGVADAVFGVRRFDKAPGPPRLGVMLDPNPDGLLVRRVVETSVAERAGIESGDVITAAAGRPITSTAALKDALARQPPGTILPIGILRDGQPIEIEARMPGDR